MSIILSGLVLFLELIGALVSNRKAASRRKLLVDNDPRRTAKQIRADGRNRQPNIGIANRGSVDEQFGSQVDDGFHDCLIFEPLIVPHLTERGDRTVD
jgi:hypothetical protein